MTRKSQKLKMSWKDLLLENWISESLKNRFYNLPLEKRDFNPLVPTIPKLGFSDLWPKILKDLE